MAAKKSVTLFDVAIAWIEHQVKKVSVVFSRRTHSIRNIGLGLAFTIYFIAQFNLSVGPVLVRQTPVEEDDAYSYIIQSSFLQSGCYSNECPALTSLGNQLNSPTTSQETAAIRQREYQRIFYFYHPFHTFVFSGLNSAGLTWEQAYDSVWIVGKIFIIFAVAYWVVSIWGSTTGAVALFLLSLTAFHSQGLHAVVPGNLALALALILWAEVYRGLARVAIILTPLLVILLCLHPIGLVYGLLILVFALLSSPWPIRKPLAVSIGVGFIIIAFSVVISNWVTWPDLTFNPVEFYPSAWDYLEGFKQNLPTTMLLVTNWAAHFNGLLFVVTFVLFGLLTFSGNQKKLLLLFGVLFGVSATSFFYTVPVYGALSFERIWVAFAIFLTAAIAEGYVTMTSSIYHIVNGKSRGRKRVVPFSKKWQVGIAGVLFLFLAISFGKILFSQLRNYRSTYISMAYSWESGFNPAQPGMLASQSDSYDGVLYMEELSLYYYLTYGPLDVNAIYYPAIAGTPEESEWILNDPEKVDFVVAPNPVYGAPHTAIGAIKLNPEETLVINATAPINLATLELFVNQRANPIDMTLTMVNGESMENTKVTLPAGPAGWVGLGTELLFVDRVILWLRPSAAPMQISGLRFHEDAPTNWPWDQGVTLILRSKGGEEFEATFNAIRLSQTLGLTIEILDDKGYSVLARVID